MNPHEHPVIALFFGYMALLGLISFFPLLLGSRDPTTPKKIVLAASALLLGVSGLFWWAFEAMLEIWRSL